MAVGEEGKQRIKNDEKENSNHYASSFLMFVSVVLI